MARAAATRLLAELTGRPALHPLLASSGAAAALAAQGAQLVRCHCPLPPYSSPPHAHRSGPHWLRCGPAGLVPLHSF